MAGIKIKKEILEDMELAWGGALEDNIIDQTRWSIIHEIIFEYDWKFYKTYYSVGATEMQDESPWEFEEEVECTEVHQVEKMVKVWGEV